MCFFIIYYKDKIKSIIIEFIVIKVICGGIKPKYDNYVSGNL